MIKIFIAVITVLALFSGIIIYNERNSKDKLDIVFTGAKTQSVPVTNNQISPTAKPMPDSKLIIDPKVTYTAKVSTTKGSFTIELNQGETPKTVNNFVTLASKGFYDTTIFHRVIKGFMIQGGDPTGTGRGGPGYKFDDEKFIGTYTRGTVAMANSGPNTNGSQFFIMHEDQDLPPNYTIFGHVVDGLDTVDAIATQEVTYGDSGEQSTPVSPVKITSIEIVPSVTVK